MSEIVIALLLIVPVLIVTAVLSYSHKKKKKKKTDKLAAYVHEVTDQPAFKPHFQKHLVHQLVVIDEGLQEILIVNHHKDNLTHQQFSIDNIGSAKVVSLKETIRIDDKRTELITSQIGVEIRFKKPEKEVFLVVYDHIEHNIFQMADLENEARELHKRITGTKVPVSIA